MLPRISYSTDLVLRLALFPAFALKGMMATLTNVSVAASKTTNAGQLKNLSKRCITTPSSKPNSNAHSTPITAKTSGASMTQLRLSAV